MSDFVTSLLSFMLLPFKLTSSPLVIVPLSFIVVSGSFLMFKRFLRKH